MDTSRILLDVGGTFIKCSDGRMVPIPSGGTEAQIAASLKQAIFTPEAPAEIGVAIPGPFDYREGIFLMKHKFAAVYGKKFADIAGLPKGSRLRFIHDVNAVLEGALAMNGLKDRNVALITIGTGLGFTYSVKGKVQYGPMLSPIRALYNVPYRSGILEDVVSARGIVNAYVERTGRTSESAYDIAMRAYAGEIEALEVYNGVGEALADVLPEMLDELGIDTLLMGGQISKSLNLIDRPLRNALEGISVEMAPDEAVFTGIDSLFADVEVAPRL
jgi:glucokinase